MGQQIARLALAIERKAEQLRQLAGLPDDLEVDRLREEAAALQAMISEANRLRVQERRFEMRGPAVLAPVLLESAEFSGFCLIRNLTAEGMKAQAYGWFSREQPISIHFTSHHRIEGRLVWFGSGEVGVNFDERIDVATVLAGLGGGASGGPQRPVRLPVQRLAEVSVGSHFGIAEVGDISQRGLKILTPLNGVGQQVAVQVEELDERMATVRWTRAGSTGLAFTKPLSLRELARIA